MESVHTSSNEEAVSDNQTEMPVLQDMLNDISEATASCAQMSNTSLPTEDFLLEQALALPQISNSAATTGENDSVDAADASTEKSSDSIVDGLISSGKRFSIALNNQTPSTIAELLAQSTDNTTVQQTSVQQIDTAQSLVAPPSESVPAPTTVTPKKRQHIMISYNRSCEDTCRKIRNSLRALKYKVWMDVFDMRGNIIDGMANAIRNSYLVLMCINDKYEESYWCRKEADDIAMKQIQFIPCLMEESYTPQGWLALVVGANVWIDFSNVGQFDSSLKNLIKEIDFVEEKLATNPRETPPLTPTIDAWVPPMPSSTAKTFDTIIRNFKTWVEDNRDDLKQFDQRESAQLINELIQGLESDVITSDDENRKELLRQLLSCTSQRQNNLMPQLVNSLTTFNYPVIKSLLFIMALWAVRVVYKSQ